MDNDLNYLKKQHVVNYKNTLLQMVLNNNNSLFDEDIMSLLKKPPLESMDLIKSKLINITKKYKIIINTESYDDIVSKYREDLLVLSNGIKEERLNFYNDIVNNFNFDNNNDIIKILKKDTINLNKVIRKLFKSGIIDSYIKNFDKNFDKLFMNDLDTNIKDEIHDKFRKYINSNYVKQLLENIDIKILVKDTILINSFKEEGEKYLYTLNNSHLFD